MVHALISMPLKTSGLGQWGDRLMIGCMCCGRRGFLIGATTTGLLGSLHRPLLAQAAGPAPATSGPPSLPERGEFVVRNGHVLTMDPALGDIPGGDVHVKDGVIVAAGPALRVPPGVLSIDASGMIVLPGLIETHWHMWNSLFRSMSGDQQELGYFPMSAALGKVMTAAEMYQGTRLAAAEAISSGITFVHDWCHNVRAPDYASENLRALRESGIRGRFSWGYAQGQAPDQAIDLAGLEAMHTRWAEMSDGGRLSLGLAWRGSILQGRPLPAEVYRRELDTARRLGLPISVHVNLSRARAGQIAAMAREGGLLGPDMQLIHVTAITPEELRAIKEAGASVSLSPLTEMRIGFGLPRTGEFLAAGIPIGLSVDTTDLSGNADMFAIMKVIQNVENGVRESEFALPARRVLELATSEGARAMGVERVAGSLTPGKRADLIAVSTGSLNMAPGIDPAHLLVEAAQPANVELVVVDGRVLKRDGRLTAVDPAVVVAGAKAALTDLRRRAAP